VSQISFPEKPIFVNLKRMRDFLEDKMAIRIILADDADMMILGMRTVLESNHRYAVVGTARSIGELLCVAKSEPADLIIFNEWLYNTDVLSTVEKLRETVPLAKLLVMGALADGLLIRDLFHAGARGYLYKGDDLCQILVTAIETVMLDRPYLSPTANAEYLISMQSPNANERLDPESRQVLQLLAHGEHAGEISERMGIDKRRVYWVREKLRRRFGAKTNEHLIQRATAEGFIYPRD
jgi:DNA-binding NarL/FixJ family response regulator